MELRTHQKEALDVMRHKRKGIICVPTGGGKTMIAIEHAKNLFRRPSLLGHKTIVVVAPRLLLANQLCSEFTEHIIDACVLHVHSGDSGNYHSTTKPDKISTFCYYFRKQHRILFTTYHSLHKIQESGIHVDAIYFDEAHNSVQRNFYPAVRFFATRVNGGCYFFTATPKFSSTPKRTGMNDNLFGGIIYNVPAPRLVKSGSILPPEIKTVKIPVPREKGDHHLDCQTLLDQITNEDHMEKVLVAAPNTKVLMRMLSETEFCTHLKWLGYDLFWITAKHGAFINNKKVSRDDFFDTMKEYGQDPDKKFVLLHYSILSEGISVPGLTSLILLRNMNVIEMCQSVGRVLRPAPDKQFGNIVVPTYSNNVGIQTSRRLQSVYETAFVDGEPVVATMRT